MPDKVFKTYDEQIELLRCRGVHIDDVTTAMQVLRDDSYYNVINGYKLLFVLKKDEQGNDIYKPGASFEEIFSLFNFDTVLRKSCFDAILKAERRVKSILAYEFAQRYGHIHTAYLDRANFDAVPFPIDASEPAPPWHTPQWMVEQEWKGSPPGAPATFTRTYAVKMIEAVDRNIREAMGTQNSSIKHYMSQYGYLPPWVLVNTLTMGTTTQFYRCMHMQDRKKVAARFSSKPGILWVQLCILTLFRNCCAHGIRLYEFKLADDHNAPGTPWDYLVGHSATDPCTSLDRRTRAFCLLPILRALLPAESVRRLCSEVSDHLRALEPQLHTIGVADVMQQMGFPDDWQRIQEDS
jgi:abortive infection bacteriophage resistance protein